MTVGRPSFGGWLLVPVSCRAFRGVVCVGVGVGCVCDRQVFKGTRWMPWHQEPKKDVGICEKPGGVDNRTLIPGCPNGETPLSARVTG